VARRGKSILLALVFPFYRVLVRLSPGLAWRLAQQLESKFWETALEGHPDIVSTPGRPALQEKIFRYYEDVWGERLGALDGVVLEVGCGPAGIIASVGGRVRIGVEPLLRTLDTAELKADPVSYVCASGEALPLPDATVDAVLCVNVIDHSPRPLPLLDEMLRVLRPGGELYLYVDVNPAHKASIDYILHPGRLAARRVERHVAPRLVVEEARVLPVNAYPGQTCLALRGRRRYER
jgi:SAM-dependent methyltransferase